MKLYQAGLIFVLLMVGVFLTSCKFLDDILGSEKINTDIPEITTANWDLNSKSVCYEWTVSDPTLLTDYVVSYRIETELPVSGQMTVSDTGFKLIFEDSPTPNVDHLRIAIKSSLLATDEIAVHVKIKSISVEGVESLYSDERSVDVLVPEAILDSADSVADYQQVLDHINALLADNPSLLDQQNLLVLKGVAYLGIGQITFSDYAIRFAMPPADDPFGIVENLDIDIAKSAADAYNQAQNLSQNTNTALTEIDQFNRMVANGLAVLKYMEQANEHGLTGLLELTNLDHPFGIYQSNAIEAGSLVSHAFPDDQAPTESASDRILELNDAINNGSSFTLRDTTIIDFSDLENRDQNTETALDDIFRQF